MKRQDRTPEVYYYDWSISRWRTSETRAALTMAGRGIYREILDLCYAQGGIPKDFQLLASMVGCAPIEIEQIWPTISRHFYQDKHDKNRLRNKFSDVRRKTFFKYVKTQRTNAKTGGEVKASGNNKMSSSGSSGGTATAVPKGRVGKGIELAREKPQQQFGEWELTATAIQEHFDDFDYPFLIRIATAAAEVLTEFDSPKILLTDEILAKAIRHCYRGDTQTGAGLYLSTVPKCIRSWARNGVRSRDHPEAPKVTSVEEFDRQRRENDAKTKEILRSKGLMSGEKNEPTRKQTD